MNMRPDHVYIFRARDTNFYKIGRTRGTQQNIQRRLNMLRTGCPFQLDVAAIFSLENHNMERIVHHTMDEWRVHGEWFDIPENKVTDLCNALSKLQVECDCSTFCRGTYRRTDTNFLAKRIKETYNPEYVI